MMHGQKNVTSSACFLHVKLRRLFFQTFIKHACMTSFLEDNFQRMPLTETFLCCSVMQG